MDMLETEVKSCWVRSFLERFKVPPNLILVKSCTSTMDLARENLKGNLSEKLISSDNFFTCIFAQEQNKGRGRKNRTWQSEKEQGIYLTIFDHRPFTVNSLEGLSLAVGLAINRTLKTFNVDSKLKWPNDILVNSKKISGVLIETLGASPPSHVNIMVGIGLNYGQTEFPKELNATSIKLENSELPKIEIIAAELSFNVIDIIDLFKRDGFKSLKREWWDNSSMSGMLVRNDEMNIEGQCVGISEKGYLIVDSNGERKEVFVGDVTFLA